MMEKENKRFRVYIKNLSDDAVELARDAGAVICLTGEAGNPAVTTFYALPTAMADIVGMVNALDRVREVLIDAAAQIGFEQLKSDTGEDEDD